MAASAPPSRAPRAVIVPDLPIADAARLAMATGVAAMMHHEAEALAGEIEPLHQMRVAARRLRATVQLFAGVIHGSRLATYKRDLPWLGREAGAVRECDVIEALIRDCGLKLDPALAGGLTPLIDTIAASRDADLARFANDLRTRRYGKMCERLVDPLLRRALPVTDVGCNSASMIEPISRSVRKAGKHLSRGAPPELFHRLRVRIKRLRYALEMMAEMGGKRAQKALMRLEEMQELLGLQQDVVATVAWLRTYAGNAKDVPPETMMAVGAILQMLVEEREKLAARAYRKWKKVAHSGVIEDALAEISHAARHRLESARDAQAATQAQAAAELDAQADPVDDPPLEVEDPMPADAESDAPVAATPADRDDAPREGSASARNDAPGSSELDVSAPIDAGALTIDPSEKPPPNDASSPPPQDSSAADNDSPEASTKSPATTPHNES
jgi:CHAD domain-containing protein